MSTEDESSQDSKTDAVKETKDNGDVKSAEDEADDKKDNEGILVFFFFLNRR